MESKSLPIQQYQYGFPPCKRLLRLPRILLYNWRKGQRKSLLLRILFLIYSIDDLNFLQRIPVGLLRIFPGSFSFFIYLSSRRSKSSVLTHHTIPFKKDCKINNKNLINRY
uniref:Uncharacterized protein n=1 Tax=Utricularia reniformis TaxID=192314 RepID=A0A1Y0B2Q7_9LAMI|nr:hypothetical protein AEK19_MT1545 [Utricularia reniformis]ART31732.1 hypothetical protein AEK19_MT1545 [Utricularia reniformis]